MVTWGPGKKIKIFVPGTPKSRKDRYEVNNVREATVGKLVGNEADGRMPKGVAA